METVERRFIGIVDAAKYSGISRRTLRRMIAAGILKAYQPGGRLLFDLVELDTAIRAAEGRTVDRLPPRRLASGKRKGK